MVLWYTVCVHKISAGGHVMKHVGIVFKNTENADAMDFLKNSLENIFEDYVEFTLYYT